MCQASLSLEEAEGQRGAVMGFDPRNGKTCNGYIKLHLFSRQGPNVVWLELLPQPFSPSPVSPRPSPLLTSTCIPVQGLAKKPWESLSFRPRISLRASLPRDASSIPPWSRLPVLLNFFTAPDDTREFGDNKDVSDKLLIVSDKCSLFPAWLDPQPPTDDPMTMPRSSSDGSIESSRVYPGLVLPRPLLWLRWWPIVARRVREDEGLSLGLRVWTGEEMVVLSSGSCRGQTIGTGSAGKVNSRFCGGETLKLSPSSKVVWRLPSELPVASDESLWDGYWKMLRRGVRKQSA